jgi:hypothetical protein
MEDVLCVITDESKRFDELKLFLEDFHVPYKIFPPVFDKSNYIGIRKAHQNVVKWAKENNLRRVIIAEDDMMFSYRVRWENVINIINSLPKDFDIFLGGTHRLRVTERVTENLFRTDYFSTTHFYVLNNKFYDEFINNENPMSVDIWMSELGKNSYIHFPFLAFQRPSFSLRENRMVDHTRHVKKCFEYMKNYTENFK